MKRSLVIALLAGFAVCGCQKLETKEVVSGGKVFTAIMEAMAGDAIDTKTSMDADGNVLWKKGDQVSIFAGSALNEQYQVTDASDGKTAASLNPVSSSGFVGGGEIANNVAFYPYASTAGIAKSGGSYVISDIALPTIQHFANASFGNGAFPMAALTNSASDYNLKFKNVLGGLKLQLKGTAVISSITITGNNDDILCGAASVTVSNTAAPAIELTDATANTVTLNCGGGVRLDAETATTFIIALPPMTMSGGFTVTVTDIQSQSMEIKTTRSQTIARSNLLAMPAVNYVGTGAVVPGGAVDLGLTSGLMWASCNLCEDGFVSSPEEYGDYYAWGELEPYYASGHSNDSPCRDWREDKTGYNWASYRFELGTDENGPFSKYVTKSDYGNIDDKTVLDLEDDAARQTLGGNWRMPTDAEWTELRTKCSWTWTTQGGKHGYKVTSATNGNSIFLPAAGSHGDNTFDSNEYFGFYWSSSLSTNKSCNAWEACFGEDIVYRAGSNRRFGYSIRPVTK